MNAVCVEDLLEVVEAMKGAAADESISASKASDKLERNAHLATEAAYSAVIDKLEGLRVYAVTRLDDNGNMPSERLRPL